MLGAGAVFRDRIALDPRDRPRRDREQPGRDEERVGHARRRDQSAAQQRTDQERAVVDRAPHGVGGGELMRCLNQAR